MLNKNRMQKEGYAMKCFRGSKIKGEHEKEDAEKMGQENKETGCGRLEKTKLWSSEDTNGTATAR